VVQVPGFTHPVEDFYLEDALRLTGYQEAAVRELEGAGVAAASIRPGAGAGTGGSSNAQVGRLVGLV
jgi:hypothetical protein